MYVRCCTREKNYGCVLKIFIYQIIILITNFSCFASTFEFSKGVQSANVVSKDKQEHSSEITIKFAKGCFFTVAMIATHCILCQTPKKITIAHDLCQTLRLTSHQCDQKCSVGDQNFITGRQHVAKLLSPRHLKFQGEIAFLKQNIKLPCTTVVKQSINFTIAIFTQCHIVLAASPNTDIVGENMTWQ